MTIELRVRQTDEGVAPIVAVVLGRREIGKTVLMQACAPLFCRDRAKLGIVSPIPTLKMRMPDVAWYKVSVTNKGGIDKLFRGWMTDGKQRFILADEADELTAANAAGTAGGFVAQGVYDFVNYGREQGLGIMLSSRRPANIAKDVCANANFVFVGNTVDPAALDYLSAWMYDPAHPETDYRSICRLLPDHVFMVWSPISNTKFIGYVTVNKDAMELEEWDRSLLKNAPNAESTGPSDTPSTGSSGEATATGASIASGASSSSPTAPGPSSAPITPR